MNWSPFVLLIINNKILSNFQKQWCTFGSKKKHLKKNKDCPLSRFECFGHAKTVWFVSSFEHVNFAINEKYSQKLYDNPKYGVNMF
jgi:hypothetical protein